MKQHLIITCLTASLLTLPLPAADRVPKEMKMKHVRDGTVLIDEKFDAATLDQKWIIPKGETGSTVKLEEGRAIIEAGNGKQGVIMQKFDAPVKDATAQLLLKPYACPWMVVRFMNTQETAAREWKIGVAVYETGRVAVIVPDGNGVKAIKSVKINLSKDDWWRVAVESKSDHLYVRVNGDEVLEVQDPGA